MNSWIPLGLKLLCLWDLRRGGEMILPKTSPWVMSFEVRVPSALTALAVSLCYFLSMGFFVVIVFLSSFFFPFRVFILVFISFCSPGD